MKKNLFQKNWIWFAAIFTIAAIILMTGENPFVVFKVLFLSAFGSFENISYTLFYATPLLLTGLSVQLALEAGLFNIGAEGQLYFGALFAVIWGIFAGKILGPGPAGFESKIFFWIFGLLFSFLGGAFWGAIAGWLKAYRKTHEVISTIMLNFLAMAFLNWIILNPLKNPDIQYPETTWLPEALQIPALWIQTRPSLLIALGVAALGLWLVHKTWWGFQFRAAGKNPVSASLAGVRTARFTFFAMVLSGGVAGLVGFHEVYCHSYRLIDGFSPGFGFTGLAIALLSGGKLKRLLLAALLFGALHKGALDLDIETDKITRDLSAVIQAVILVALAGYMAIQKNQRALRGKP